MNSTGRVWARIRRIAASDRISGLIMLAFAFAGLVLANLPWTSHMFEAVCSSPTTTLEITVTDEFGRSYTETMSRPRELYDMSVSPQW